MGLAGITHLLAIPDEWAGKKQTACPTEVTRLSMPVPVPKEREGIK